MLGMSICIYMQAIVLGWSTVISLNEAHLSLCMNAWVCTLLAVFLFCSVFPFAVVIAMAISAVNRMSTAQRHTRQWSLTPFWMTSRYSTARFRDTRVLSSSPTSPRESSASSLYRSFLLILYSVQFQHFEDVDTLSVCWGIWVFP